MSRLNQVHGAAREPFASTRPTVVVAGFRSGENMRGFHPLRSVDIPEWPFAMNLELKASRRALADAKKAAELFRRGGVDFQLVWVLTAAFLGIIPDVLKKVDKNKCPEARTSIDEILSDYKQATTGPKKIRDMIMHQYAELHEGVDVYTVGVYQPGVYQSRRISRSTFKGRHPAHVIEESIQMWESILDKIEHRLRTRS